MNAPLIGSLRLRAEHLQAEADTLRAAADLLQKVESEVARYKRLEAILRDQSDVNYEGDGPNAAMSILTQWEGPCL